MTPRRFPPRRRDSKLGNVRTELDGHSFASKLEASVYQLLKYRKLAGEIRSIQVQDHVHLTAARIAYVPDFRCEMADGSIEWTEAKGMEGPRWPTIKKLWRFYGPGPLHIWKGDYRRPRLAETIVPQGVSDETEGAAAALEARARHETKEE